MTVRILTTGLVCASLFAAVLGTGANAQDEQPTPTPSATAMAGLSATPTPAATQSATPFASPVETVLAPTPTATSEATATPTGTPDSTPESTPSATPESTPSATPTGTPAPRDERGGDDQARPCRVRSLSGAAVRPRTGFAGATGEGSTRGRDCVPSGDDSARGKDADGDKGGKDGNRAGGRGKADDVVEPPSKPLRNADGTPTLDNPGLSMADLGAAPIGVPNFFIDKFRIPPFLLPIYQAAGMEYGIRWEVLAAINEIETDYGRNLNVSSAGALGWMQFMPGTWDMYGTDANGDGLEDPYNPVDAIFSAARYLRAAGAETDLRRAIFAYNHADWYVDSVIMRARLIGGLPANFVGSLTGLTQGRFPVWSKATYAGDLDERARSGRKAPRGNAAFVVESETARRGIRIFARRGAPVVAVNDGRIVGMGKSKRLGRFVKLQDVYGNTYTYANLGKVSATYPAAKHRKVSKAAVRRELDLPRDDAAPTVAASETERPAGHGKAAARKAAARKAAARKAAARKAASGPHAKVWGKHRGSAGDDREAVPEALPTKERLFANPQRPNAYRAGGAEQIDLTDFDPVSGGPLKVNPKDYDLRPLRKGASVIAGTILGRIGKVDRQAPHVLFEIRPSGRGAPRIDPKPILDGWKLLESTAIYRAAGKNPFFGTDSGQPTIGQILLMSKETLAQRVVNNPRIDVYACGRQDIQTGQIDRRVLATLEFLAASGLRPTVTSLKCGHGFYTASGNVSHHSSGNAVDIAAINGIPIIGHQGPGSITDIAVQRLLTLQGTMKPDQIITLMTFAGADNTFAMSDHHDHIHVGWRPLYGTNAKASKQINAVLQPDQWIKLIDRLKDIDNPEVSLQPSKYAVKVVKRASRAHKGE